MAPFVWLTLFVTQLANANEPAVVQLQWLPGACPSERALKRALTTYDITVSAKAKVRIAATMQSHDVTLLTLDTETTHSIREVALPEACADRAAVLAVVIETLVAPLFWPAGRPKAAASQPAAPPPTKITAFDLIAPPATEPASLPDATANEPATEQTSPLPPPTLPPSPPPVNVNVPVPVPEQISPTPTPTPTPTPLRLALTALASFDLAVSEPTRARFGLEFSLSPLPLLRMFIEAAALTPRTATHAPGRLTFSDGQLTAGADILIYKGLFAGAGAGLRLLYAEAKGFDENHSTWLAAPTLQARIGYRHVFFDHLELGAQAILRIDLIRERLLIDQTPVTQPQQLHVGIAATVDAVF